MKKLPYEILVTIKPFFDRNNEYYVVKVRNTVFSCQKERFKEYILDCNEDLWSRVNDWIDNYVLPLINRKTINYKAYSSDGLKELCERCIGEYVSAELIMYIIALKGIPGENKQSSRMYPTRLYYPLSSQIFIYMSEEVL